MYFLSILFPRGVRMPRAPTSRASSVQDPISRKSRYGGMNLSQTNRLKQFEDESGTLKHLVADVMPDTAVLKDLLGKS